MFVCKLSGSAGTIAIVASQVVAVIFDGSDQNTSIIHMVGGAQFRIDMGQREVAAKIQEHMLAQG